MFHYSSRNDYNGHEVTPASSARVAHGDFRVNPTCMIEIRLRCSSWLGEELRMNEEEQITFTEMVRQGLTTEPTRGLWSSMAQEYDRTDGGPNEAVEWLKAQQIHLHDRVQKSLRDLKNQIEGW